MLAVGDLLRRCERDRLTKPSDARLVFVLIQGSEAIESEARDAWVLVLVARRRADSLQDLGSARAPREPAGGQGRLKRLEQRIPREPGVEQLQRLGRVEPEWASLGSLPQPVPHGSLQSFRPPPAQRVVGVWPRLLHQRCRGAGIAGVEPGLGGGKASLRAPRPVRRPPWRPP